jgi:hypothetical protein
MGSSLLRMPLLLYLKNDVYTISPAGKRTTPTISTSVGASQGTARSASCLRMACAVGLGFAALGKVSVDGNVVVLL